MRWHDEFRPSTVDPSGFRTMPIGVIDLVHDLVGRAVRPGDVCIDATAGNGHDTEHMARLVGSRGRVFAIDVQEEALRRAGARMDREGLRDRVTFVRAGHELAAARLPASVRGRVAAVMFNLGYLPGTTGGPVTRAETTLRALDDLWSMLRVGGVMTVVVYRGHEGGNDEADAVEGWVGRRAALDGAAARFRPVGTAGPAPEAFLLRRRADRSGAERKPDTEE